MSANQIVLSKNLANLFHSDVIKWRQYAAKMWGLILISTLIQLNYLLVNMPMTLGFAFFTEILGKLINFNLWLITLIILLGFWFVYTFNDKQFKVSPKVYPNNIDKYIQILYSVDSLYLLSQLVVSMITSALLLKITYSYEQLTRSTIFYIVSFCSVSNFFNNMRFLIDQDYLLKWPIVKQSKFFRFKTKLYKCAIESMKNEIAHYFVWTGFHTLIGFLINPFSTPLLLFNLKCWFICINLSFIINFSNKISWCLYEIYLTEIYHFPIQSKDPKQLTLPIAISLDSSPYIQMLGLIDFVDLSVYSKSKRKQLLSLNYPSGLPSNWNSICTETLDLIRKFMDIFDFDDMLHGSKVTEPFETPEISLKAVRRNIASMYESSYIEKSDYITKSKSRESNLIEPLTNKLKRSEFFSKFYNQNENYKNQQLFLDSQLIIHALKALSNIAMASFSEDQYGIVQQTLPTILTTFVQLQRILQNFYPGTSNAHISFKILQREDANYIDLIVQKLIFTLNESIHKIVLTFGSSLESLNLNANTEKILKQCYLNK